MNTGLHDFNTACRENVEADVKEAYACTELDLELSSNNLETDISVFAREHGALRPFIVCLFQTRGRARWGFRVVLSVRSGEGFPQRTRKEMYDPYSSLAISRMWLQNLESSLAEECFLVAISRYALTQF